MEGFIVKYCAADNSYVEFQQFKDFFSAIRFAANLTPPERAEVLDANYNAIVVFKKV